MEDQPLWSMADSRSYLDEWLSVLAEPPHDARNIPGGRPEREARRPIEAAGYVPVALSGDDYIELLPAGWRKVNAYGIKVARRSYDSEELNPLRLQPSGISEHGDRWEVRHDPYDVSKIHVRGPDGWITVFWKHLDRAPLPFGELAWDHARRSLGREATEEQIATPSRRCCAARTPDLGKGNPR